MIKKFFTSIALLLVAQWMFAQQPEGYYASTKGASGELLKTAMHHVIKGHTVCSYKEARAHFSETDRRENGEVWDMYSNATHYTYGGRTARYSGEGAGYNCEHSFPKSWFGGENKPMYTDLFHLYPTDGYINSRRWHYPFGETNGEVYASAGFWSKLGKSTIPGYEDVVFEPNDEYKGDFARTYFYMATRYEDVIANWKFSNGEKVPMLNNTSYQVYEPWALEMLLRWAQQDPVSQKEIDRNNAVFKIQHNRNPFIDFPGLEEYIWGQKTNVAFDPDHYDAGAGGGDQPAPLPAPLFSVPSGEVAAGTEVTISSTVPEATIVYSVNGGEEQTHASPVTLVVNENLKVSAYVALEAQRSRLVSAHYTVVRVPEYGEGVYVKVTRSEDLDLGCRYLIVCEENNTAMSVSSKDIRGYAEVSVSANTIETEVALVGLPYAFILDQTTSGYTFYDYTEKSYLALTSDKNKLNSLPGCDGPESHWTITIDNGNTTISSVKYPKRSIQYNGSAPRFATYTSTQLPVSLYKETVLSAIETPVVSDGCVDVYDLKGRCLRAKVNKKVALRGLLPGLYVVGGTKVIVR